MDQRGIRRALPGDGIGVGREQPGGNRRAVDHRQHAVDGGAGADLGPGESLHQRFWQSQTRGLDQNVFGRHLAVEKARQGRHEIIGDGAAEASIGQLDNIVLVARRVAAAEQQLAVDAELAEFIDDDGEPPPLGMRQQMPHEARLAGAEKAGNHRRRNAAHRSVVPGRRDRAITPHPNPLPASRGEGVVTSPSPRVRGEGGARAGGVGG